jgi:hypothetical protein
VFGTRWPTVAHGADIRSKQANIADTSALNGACASISTLPNPGAARLRGRRPNAAALRSRT